MCLSTYMQGRTERGNGVGVGVGVVTPSPLFLKSVDILTKCVGKISWPNVVGKFGLFSIFSPAEITLLPVMTAFKDYDNNEYLAVKLH